MRSGLDKIKPDSRDYGFLHTYGGVATDPEGLPANFSIYGDQTIPNQEVEDNRFTPALAALPVGCTGETGSFESGLQDGVLYNPQDLYENTPPGGAGGRDIRLMLATLINRGPRAIDGSFGPKRLAYFNCYGKGRIDDFDAARIALWVNQAEKRGVYIGSYWYWGDRPSTTVPVPSFNTSEASLHCYLATGWITWGDEEYLEIIPWVGESVGARGKFYLSRVIYNALMGQPWTGAFTITKFPTLSPVPIGMQASIDHIVYQLTQFMRALFQL